MKNPLKFNEMVINQCNRKKEILDILFKNSNPYKKLIEFGKRNGVNSNKDMDNYDAYLKSVGIHLNVFKDQGIHYLNPSVVFAFEKVDVGMIKIYLNSEIEEKYFLKFFKSIEGFYIHDYKYEISKIDPIQGLMFTGITKSPCDKNFNKSDILSLLKDNDSLRFLATLRKMKTDFQKKGKNLSAVEELIKDYGIDAILFGKELGECKVVKKEHRSFSYDGTKFFIHPVVFLREKPFVVDKKGFIREKYVI